MYGIEDDFVKPLCKCVDLMKGQHVETCTLSK
jgi:hypothetical protein